MDPERLEACRQQARDALSSDENAEAIDAICEANGWTRDDFVNSRHELREMELFLLQFGPSIPQLRYLPWLVTLKLHHVGLTEMRHLEGLVNLEVLWMSENDITRIEGLENCEKLRELYLHNNLIKKMENLRRLRNLEVLWLCRNALSRIEETEYLPKLRSLWVAGNLVSTLQGAFTEPLSYLQELNVAGNRISSFRDIPILNELKALETLYFSDPQYGENPVCQLSNYQTFTLFHLQHVRTLDYVHISAEQRQLAESTFVKKKIYYSMRIHTIQRNLINLLNAVHNVASKKTLEAEASKTVLERLARNLDQDTEEYAVYGTTSAPDITFRTKQACDAALGALTKVRSAIASRRREIELVERKSSEACRHMQDLTEGHTSRLLLELNTGGNVRMEEGRLQKEVWHQSCGELLRTRFFAQDFDQFGIKDIQVRKVTRVHNRGLRSRFDTALGGLVDLSDVSYKRALEYLFFALPLDSDASVNDALEHGFNADALAALKPICGAAKGGIPMTNSVFLAEQARLMQARAAGKFKTDGPESSGEVYAGRMLVCKVFLGKCVAEKTAAVDTSATAAPLVAVSPNIVKSDYPPATTSVYRCKPQDPKQRIWFCFDAELILPEYVVEYSYTPSSAVAPVPAVSEYGAHNIEETNLRFKRLFPSATPVDLSDFRAVGIHCLSFLHWCDTSPFSAVATREAATALAEPISFCPRPVVGGELNDEVLQGYRARLCPADGSQQKELTLVNLHQLKIRQLAVSTACLGAMLAHVRVLVLFDNELLTLPWNALAEAAPLLESLDVSHNQLKRLNDVAGSKFPTLTILLLDCNYLHALDDVKFLALSCPILTHVSLSQNPCMLDKRSQLFVCSVIRTLMVLSHVSIAEQRDVVLHRLTPRVIDGPLLGFLVPTADSLSHGCITSDAPATDPTKAFRAYDEAMAAYVAHGADNKGAPPAPLIAVSSQLPPAHVLSINKTQIESLDKIDRLRRIVHLRMRGNFIVDMEPLIALSCLETLDLEDNRIRRICGLSGLTRLRRIDLSKNYIERIEGVETLKALQFFAISHNRLTTLAPAAQMTTLLELYCCSNLIASEKEALHLRDLPKLIILDLAGNPCVNVESYRSYVVFQVKRLKVLDGISIDANEIQVSRDTFAGRISAELLKERLPPDVEWANAKELNLASCALKEVTMLETFVSLTHLKLEHNQLGSIDGLRGCVNLVALNLSHNKLGQCCVGKVFECMPNLESLSLEANGIASIAALQLNCQRLKFLNLKANEILKVDGLDRVPQLREILLDRNRLRAIERDSLLFVPYLRELYCEENCIKSIEGIHVAVQLQKVSFASNRINEVSDIGKHIEGLAIVDICFLGNPVVRKAYYRNHLIHSLPNAAVIDNRVVAQEERERVEASYQQDTIPPNVFTDVRMPMQGGPIVVPVPPAQNKVPLKIHNMMDGETGVLNSGSHAQRGRPPQTSGSVKSVGQSSGAQQGSTAGVARTNSADVRTGAQAQLVPSPSQGNAGPRVSGPANGKSFVSPSLLQNPQPSSFRKK